MGRVYAYPFDPERGERNGMGKGVFTEKGERLAFVQRVELEADADEGMATVTALAHTREGSPLVDFDRGTPCRVTFRTWVRVCDSKSPPPKTPDALLGRAADGTVGPWTDPIPEVPFDNKE